MDESRQSEEEPVPDPHFVNLGPAGAAYWDYGEDDVSVPNELPPWIRGQLRFWKVWTRRPGLVGLAGIVFFILAVLFGMAVAVK